MIKVSKRKKREIPDDKVHEIVSLWYEGLGARLIAELVGFNYCQVRGICSGQFYTDVAGPMDVTKRKKPQPNLNRVRLEQLRQERLAARQVVFDPNRDPKIDPVVGDVLGNARLECKVVERIENLLRYESRSMVNSGRFTSSMGVIEWRAWATNPSYFVEVRKRGDQHD